MAAAGGFPLLGTRRVETGRLLIFERRHHRGDDLRPMVREVVRHPGSVAVAPLEEERLLLLRLHRTPIGRALLEIPAGLRDHPGEDPATTARRECEEEVGRRPGSLTLLGHFFLSPGFTDEELWLYLAEDLEAVELRPQDPEERGADIVGVPLEELSGLVAAGEIADAKTLVALGALGLWGGDVG